MGVAHENCDELLQSLEQAWDKLTKVEAELAEAEEAIRVAERAIAETREQLNGASGQYLAIDSLVIRGWRNVPAVARALAREVEP